MSRRYQRYKFEEIAPPDDDKLILLSKNITIYTESYDKKLPITVYRRPAICGCK